MKIGLFFGTFNPIHTGHLIIANYMATNTDLKQVWLIVSPLNPLKKKEGLLAGHHRLYMCKLATEDNPRLRVSDVEFSLPQPSYTIITLQKLKEKYPSHDFVLIMGEDNLVTLHKWKNFEEIISRYQIYVYPRKKESQKLSTHPVILQAIEQKTIRFFELPTLNISASYIRQCIKEKKDIRYMVPEKIYLYLQEMHFYRM